MGIPSFLLKPFVAPLLAVLAILSLAGNAYQFFHDRGVISGLNDQVTTLTRDNAALVRDNATLRVNQATLIASTVTQNAAVDGLKAAGDLAAANAKATQATVAAAAAVERASRVGAIKQAKPGIDPCTSASTLIRNTLSGEHHQ